jgi:calcineurin-like phosphoesterase family protein
MAGDLFFTSDWHFGHARICELAGRPFESVEEMNEEIIRRHNDWVSPGDTVWVLGDAAMGHIGDSLALCKRMNGTKFLISGNHDRTWAGYPQSAGRTADDWVRRYKEEGGFSFVVSGDAFARHPRNRVPIRIPVGFGAGSVDLWHFPRTGDSQSEDRFTEAWRPRPWRPKEGQRMADQPWLLHGHTHSQQNANVKARQIHVGVDAWNFEPVHSSRVIELMEEASE